MPNFSKNIKEIITRTKAGKIKWNKRQEGAFIWQAQGSENRKINVIVQKLSSSFAENNIMFRIWDFQNKRIITEKQTSSASMNTEEKTLIEELYNTITGKDSNEDILDEILDNS